MKKTFRGGDGQRSQPRRVHSREDIAGLRMEAGLANGQSGREHTGVDMAGVRMWPKVVNTFAGSPLDRRNNDRKDGAMFAEAERSENARCVVLDERYKLLEKDAAIAWVAREVFADRESESTPYLGRWQRDDGELWECFAVQVDASADTEALSPGARFSEPRGLVTKAMPFEERAIAAHARSLFEFHKRHRFCGTCGSETVSEEGGTRRRCLRNPSGERAAPDQPDACRGMWFPRTDPVVIAVVVDGGNCLLGRKREWPQGTYSALAGFMEHGESCEDAVRREIFEEAGIIVGECRYHSSQPWPFPYSLMLGFIAEAKTTEITVDEHELETANWFSSEQVRSMIPGEGELRLPPPMAIAHQLAVSFAQQEPIAVFGS